MAISPAGSHWGQTVASEGCNQDSAEQEPEQKLSFSHMCKDFTEKTKLVSLVIWKYPKRYIAVSLEN